MVRGDNQDDVAASGIGEGAQHVVEERPSAGAERHHSFLAGGGGVLLTRIELSPLVPLLHSPSQPPGQYDAEESAVVHHHTYNRTNRHDCTARAEQRRSSGAEAKEVAPVPRWQGVKRGWSNRAEPC